MIVWPALDLRGGQVVQLVGGDPRQQRVTLPDPLAVAARWLELGFRALHVVDLDAALGTGSNLPLIRSLVEELGATLQVGGGIRDDQAVAELLDAGADRVVLGTRAVLEPAWLRAQAHRHPSRITLAADCRGPHVAVRGWTEDADVTVSTLLADSASLPLAALLITDVTREGRMAGTDTARFAQLAAATPHPLIASGGITTAADLAELAAGGVAGAVLGMALYTGALDGRTLAREYAQ